MHVERYCEHNDLHDWFTFIKTRYTHNEATQFPAVKPIEWENVIEPHGVDFTKTRAMNSASARSVMHSSPTRVTKINNIQL